MGVCEVPDCNQPTVGRTKLSGRYCLHHLRRLQTYGSPVDWLPIPLEYSPGVPDWYAELLAETSWRQLSAWCSELLHRACTCGGPCRLSAMDDDEFWALFARTFPSR